MYMYLYVCIYVSRPTLARRDNVDFLSFGIYSRFVMRFETNNSWACNPLPVQLKLLFCLFYNFLTHSELPDDDT